MVVDDEPIVGKRLKPALEKGGYVVEVFESGGDALRRLEGKDFDIVVTDVRMEDVDGIQVLEHVLARSDRTKVIIITGYATVEVAREALAKGAFDFIAKPFKPNDLRVIIERAAEALRAERGKGTGAGCLPPRSLRGLSKPAPDAEAQVHALRILETSIRTREQDARAPRIRGPPEPPRPEQPAPGADGRTGIGSSIHGTRKPSDSAQGQPPG